MKRAFEAVTAKMVYETLRANGANKDVARVAVRATCHQGKMRMGATASPAIFALVLEQAIELILTESEVANVVCYADDMYVFLKPGTPNPKRILRRLRAHLWCGSRMRLNTAKTTVTKPGPLAQLPALGLVVTQRRVRPSKRHRNTLRMIDHLVAKSPALPWNRSRARTGPATVEQVRNGHLAWHRSLEGLSPGPAVKAHLSIGCTS